ncbi:MAG: MdtA/MuxA family multidrug efflux RND transporter periplasmic adaptor subunit [Sulfuricella sp.]|nr:MdtA/MuxA family multidrug efflux RND transporter periplasmic adaptor subunit [Sulfuricella sp.]
MKNKTIWIAAGVLAIAAIAAAIFYGKQETPSMKAGRGMNGAGKPVPVAIATAHKGDIDVIINALGTVTARSTVTIKPRVDGQLTRINFREGQLVKSGEVLAEIDPRPFQVQLDQANGQLVRDQALLTNAKLDLDRYRGLLAKDSIAKQQVDAQDSLVRQDEGVVQADRAQVDNAKLQLGFTRVTAPVAGRLGLRLVDAGNMVHASDATGLVVITQTQPITVIFSIPSDSLPAVIEKLQANQTLTAEAWDREGKTRLAEGKLLTADNQIDTTTGTVKLKAEFTNTDDALFPNQFVNVRLRIETRHDAILVPVAATQRGTQGTFFYVVKDDKSVSLRPVALGPVVNDIVAVEKGLIPGEQVVIDGADKLSQGAKVEAISPGTSEAGRKKPPHGEGKGSSKRKDGA